MAKTVGRRRYYRRTFRRYKQLASRNYFKIKAEFYDRIRFPSGSNGSVIFESKSAESIVANRSVLSLINIFNGYSYTQVLSGLFSYYKILSVAIELVPKYNTADNIQNGSTVFLGFKLGSNDALTMQEIKALNQNVLLDPRNRQRRYWRVFNTQGAWSSSDTVISGGLTVASENQGEKDSQHQWDMKLSLYLLYKYSKA